MSEALTAPARPKLREQRFTLKVLSSPSTTWGAEHDKILKALERQAELYLHAVTEGPLPIVSVVKAYEGEQE